MAACHSSPAPISIPEGAKRLVLAGNPNVGKSVVFNSLTGRYVDVSNYPGTTLEISHAPYGADVLLDTPGVYGLSSFNEEERIAREMVLQADLVINVVDAGHLERDLFLTQQLIDTGLPVIVALNMIDEAQRAGLQIDTAKLEAQLGVPVVPIVAIQNKNIDTLKHRIEEARPGNLTPGLAPYLAEIGCPHATQGERLLIAEGDLLVANAHNLEPLPHRETIYLLRRQRVNEICAQVIRETNEGADWSAKLSHLLVHPVSGLLFLALVLYVLYQFIGVFVAQTLVEYTEGVLMAEYFTPFMQRLIPPSGPLGELLTGEFGLLTMTPTYVLGLLLPLVVGFYFALSLLEDSGYLPRIAALADRGLNKIGLNGRAVIPLIMGFGCVTVATVTTRMLGSDRERRIAIILLALVIPCSAQLGVIAGMLAGLPVPLIVIYFTTLLLLFGLTGKLLDRVLPGQSTGLVIDLPRLRLPQPKNVLKKTWTKSWAFLLEAGPIFAVGTLLVGLSHVTGLLEVLQRGLAPLVVGWLGLPAQAATAFIMGFVRRDFGAAGLTSLTLTPEQTLVALLTITLFVPCIASVLTIAKERSSREGLLMWVGSLVVAFLIGGLINQLVTLL